MKKTVIGTVLAFISSLWAIVIGIYVQKNLIMEWYGNRFWASAVDRGVAVPLVVALLILGLSLVILGVEYFRKEK